MEKITAIRRVKRKRRVRSNISGTKKIPRISVFVSNMYIYAQVVDDVDKKTLSEFSSLKMAKNKNYKKGKKVDEAKAVGLELAKKMKVIKIKKAVFDRGRYSYKGRVKALAEGLREGGIQI